MARRRPWLRWLGWIGIALGALILIGPFLLPLPELDTVPPRELAGPTDRFVTLEGIDVRFREAGSGGPTFLLLHGFGANTRSWGPIMDDLAGLGRVIAFDRVGFGLTERPLHWEGDHPYGSSRQVELATALLGELGVAEVIVVGHSAGAEIATALAVARPDLVTRLVLESPALDSGPGSLSRLLAATPQAQRVIRFVGRRAADQVDELLESAYYDPSRVTDEILVGYRQPFDADDWDTGLALFTAAPRLDSQANELTGLEMPLLIVTGGEDTWVPTEDTVRLARGVPEADLVVLADCGHVAHEECPDAFLDAVTGWLNRR
jgi:pimeloyl-ACP methyl ester carboxylesterase